MESNANLRRARTWPVLGDVYTTNPRHLVGPEEHAMLHLWQLFELGHLPEPEAGPLGQCVINIDAFNFLAMIRRELHRERPDRGH